MNFIKYLSYILIIFLLFSCNNNNQKKISKNKNSKEPNIEELAQDWNNAHNNNDIKKFLELYSDTVEFYHFEMSGRECADKKESILNQFKNFEQTISDLAIEMINNSEYKCSFTKTCIMNGKSFAYPSYLIFIETKSGWKISTESDLVTDENIAKTSLPKNAVAGDFNSDGTPEYMWLIEPEFGEDFGECQGDCSCYINFSDNNIPPIYIENCIGGYPVNEGDLNNDGSDEIGILPDWWTSYWKGYFVYTLKDGKWQYLVQPISTHISQWQDGVDAIYKTPNKNGYVTINQSIFNEYGIIVESVEVKVD